MTNPALAVWPPSSSGYRRSEVSAVIGHGDAVWARASEELMRWRVKTASGFAVDNDKPVSKGDQVLVAARLLGLTIVEPVEVTDVVRDTDRVGFAYLTLPGHPVNGEESFIAHRHGDEVRLTVRSLTRAAPQQPWRALYPVLLIAQVIARRRYLRALR